MAVGSPQIGALDKLKCLGYDVVYDGVAITTDGKKESAEFSRHLESYLRHHYGIETRFADHSPYHLVTADDQMSQRVVLPAAEVFLEEDRNSIEVSFFNSSLDLLIDWQNVSLNQWEAFQEAQENRAKINELCKEKRTYICGLLARPYLSDPVSPVAEDIAKAYKEQKTMHESAPECNQIEKARLAGGTLYHFNGNGDTGRKASMIEWRRLFQAFSKIGIIAVSKNGFWDVERDNTQEVFFDLNTVKRNDYSPLIVRGDVIKVKGYLKDGRILEISPPLVIAMSSLDSDKMVLDLAGVGMGKFSHIIRSQAHYAITRIGPNDDYGLVITPKYPAYYDIHRQYLDEIGLQLARTEAAWGFKAGTISQVVYVVPCMEDNAEVRPTNPSTVLICDNTVQRVFEDRHIVSHEFFHLLDFTSHAIKGGRLADMFHQLEASYDGQAFLRLIAERNFFFPNSFGGHPWDSPMEFLATLLNSLNHPEWEKMIDITREGLLRLYLDSLIAARHDLVPVIGKEHKMIEKIDYAVSYIRNNLGL